MKEEFDKNLDKFEVYCKRNVFVPLQNVTSPPESSTSTQNISAELETLTSEIDSLKIRYLDLRQSQNKLSAECRETDLLLKDMRHAMFRLRVGSQVLEEHNIQNLADSMSSMVQYRQTLNKLTQNAEGSPYNPFN